LIQSGSQPKELIYLKLLRLVELPVVLEFKKPKSEQQFFGQMMMAIYLMNARLNGLKMAKKLLTFQILMKKRHTHLAKQKKAQPRNISGKLTF